MKATLIAVLLAALVGCGGDDDGASPETADVTVASLNVLHGVFCPPATLDCRVADRVELLFDWLEAAGCPDVVTLQEVLGERVAELIRQAAGERCPFAYHVLEPPLRGQNFTLSRHPVVESNEDPLLGGIRILWHTRIDHPTGTVDVFNTHLAAGIDNGSAPCAEPCPAECVAAGAVSNRDCQAAQIAGLVERRAAAGSLRILAGDFNARPDTFVYRTFAESGDWVDAYLDAGNPECNPETGVGCTSGREDEALDDMESPRSGVRSRIDYLFVGAAAGGACRWQIDDAGDGDGDGLATKIFADDPNPFADSCGPLPDPICWPSDHEGMQADLNCR